LAALTSDGGSGGAGGGRRRRRARLALMPRSGGRSARVGVAQHDSEATGLGLDHADLLAVAPDFDGAVFIGRSSTAFGDAWLARAGAVIHCLDAAGWADFGLGWLGLLRRQLGHRWLADS